MALDLDRRDWEGGCHCGAVRFSVRLSQGLRSARRCNCSYCDKRGAVVLTVAHPDIAIVSGEEKLATYRFNTGEAKHHFCAECGIYTHHRRRSDPSEYGVNAACLDGLSPLDFAEVPVFDGVHHPSDTGVKRVVGTLRFEADPAG